ncbi:MAG: helix-turn-helix transcriptional regulator [Clostridia bacterium]|nr:helix-turn-helix transcriptional regulator [Clostridia bacterium]
MTVNYNKLWKKLIDLEMSRTEMRLKAGISTKQLAKLGKNENVNTEILVKICEALGCNIDEIMDIVEQKEDTV